MPAGYHLKIARSYINVSAIDSAYAAAVRAIVTFAQELGIAVIAQGVETDSATQAQEFHFSKAVSAEKAGELLNKEWIAIPKALGETCKA
jgi:EAL domain-containing protein (putative c-di-GMP-specific phosphodiesterase class I)